MSSQLCQDMEETHRETMEQRLQEWQLQRLYSSTSPAGPSYSAMDSGESTAAEIGEGNTGGLHSVE